MQKISITVNVKADDVMQAGMIGEGIQNVLNELTPEQQQFLIELSDPAVAQSYKQRLMSIIDNPIIKTLAKKF